MASGRTRVLIIPAVLLSAVLLLFSLGAGGAPFGTACTAAADPAEKIPIRVLILPKFEVGSMSGDFPGEAQLYYENYLAGGEEYEVPYAAEGCRLYVKDGVALCTFFPRRWKTISVWAARSSTPFCREAFETEAGGP